MRPTISSVRLYIADRYGKIISVEDNEVNCTLLFVPNPKASRVKLNSGSLILKLWLKVKHL